MRASMSVPGLFKPVTVGDRLLVDGGIVNNLPIDVIKEMGADIVIAVDVGTALGNEGELTSPLKITTQMLTILMKSQSELQKKLMSSGDVLITPTLSSISTTDFDKSPEAAKLGEIRRN